ncbi:MAG TPA: DUF4388 domain-containing protein [Anaeromyxobacteraceae bacterium]|nr:DUF4388 domain-containing protein [Anaeromyxobacteraceae bacterium]
MRGLMGSLQVVPLPDLVELLARRRASGTLTCERGTVRKSAVLVDGAVIGAASNDPREYFGQFLVNFGHATDEQLSRAVHAQGDTRGRLGEVLVAQGVVTAEVVRDVLAIKIRETLLDVFLWDAGLFHLETDPGDEVHELGARVELSEIAREGEFRATAWSAFRSAFPSGAATLEVHDERVPADLPPGSVDARLIALARGGRTLDELALALHMPDFHVYQRLFALQKRGILDAVATGGDDPGAAELVERARAFLAAGRADDAEAVARRALELAPAHEGARAVLADAERALVASLEARLLERPLAPCLAIDPGELARLPASAGEKYLLSRCDGHRTVRQLVQVMPLRRLDLLRTLRRFVDAGTVVLMAPAGGPESTT